MSIDLEKNQVRVSWRYPFPRETVFRAIAAGKLLAACGGKMDEFRQDFRVGGSYQFAWGSGGEQCRCSGTFLEIVPNERVRWTWDDANTKGMAPSEVTATLRTKGNYTYIDILHERSPAAEFSHSYHQGWTEVLAGFTDELDGTTLRLAYDYAAPAARVFEALAKGLLFRQTVNEADFKRGTLEFKEGGVFSYPLGADDYVRGKFTKVTPKQVNFTWSTVDHGVKVEDTDVMIFLEDLSGGRTRLHLVHDGLWPSKVSEGHTEGWNDALKSFASVL